MNRYYIDVAITVDASSKEVALKRFRKVMDNSDLDWVDLSDIHPIGVEKLN